MHESFVAGFFLDGVEGVCAVVQVCCVPKWFVVSHVFLVWGWGSLWSAYRNVGLRVTDQNGVTTVTCRFTHYFFKNGDKYYFQIIWTHYCIIWHQMSLTGRIFTNARWQAFKLESYASKATRYLILLSIYSPWFFSSWLFEGGNIHVGQNFIKNDTHTAYVKPMKFPSVWQPEIPLIEHSRIQRRVSLTCNIRSSIFWIDSVSLLGCFFTLPLSIFSMVFNHTPHLSQISLKSLVVMLLALF